MDPHKRFCHNERCWAYARVGEGHIVIHSRKERRYRCKRCGRTFSATKGTALLVGGSTPCGRCCATRPPSRLRLQLDIFIEVPFSCPVLTF